MEVTIRRAGLADLDALIQWRMEVLREVFGLPPGEDMSALEEENRRYYASALENGGHIACFACVDGETVGCGGVCVYQELPSPDNPSGLCAYLMNVYTRPAYRGQGVGGATVDWLVRQARGLGITKIYLEASDAGRALYERLGFVSMPDQMKLP